MKASRLVSIAGKSILKNKMRTLLTMLGIIIGVGAVIVMVAIGQGAKGQIQDRINNLGTNMIVITPGASTTGGVNMGAGTSNRLTLDDYDALKREAVLLTAVSPMMTTFGQLIGGAGNWRCIVNGVSTEYATIRDWDVSSGRLFDETDQRTMRKVALIGQTVVDNLFAGSDPVGQQVRIRNVPFEIVGVLEKKGQSATGTDQDDIVLTPYTTFKARLGQRSYIPQILASTASPTDLASGMREARETLRASHKLLESDPDDTTIRNQADLAAAASGTTEVMTMLLAAIASISLVVGGIGIMNIMLVSVTERTREIGIRMAIGARGRDVMRQFLVESIVMSIIGGIIGIAVGYGSAAVVEKMTGWGTAIAPQMVGISLGFSAGVGIFFGYYPARKAASLDPIQALRYE
ncbi:MAG: ABC transporter permease [Longimicrobiales bacterium]